MKHAILSLFILSAAFAAGAQTFADARKQFENENYFRAKQQLLKLYSQDKNDERIPFYLGNAYLKLEDVDSANYYYQLIAEGNSALSLIAKAKQALNAGDKAKAKALVDKAIQKTDSKDAEIYFQAGWAYFEPTPIDVKQAIEYFENAVKLNGKNALYHMSLGDAYYENKEDGNAMNRYESASEVNPNFALAHLKLGRIYAQGLVHDMAIKSFQKALSIDSTIAIAYYELGRQYSALKDKENMSKSFNKYLALNPDDKTTRIFYANFLFQNKEYQSSVDIVMPLIKADSTNYITLRILTLNQYELKQNQEAAATMKKFWKYAEGKKVTASDYAYSARISAAISDTASARNYFAQAVAIDSTNGNLRAEYAKALYGMQRYKEAAEQYKIRLTLKGTPNDLDIYYMGRAYLNIKDYVNADSAFALFTRKQPTVPDGYLFRAKANTGYEKAEKLQGFAIPYYEKYIELASADPVKNKKYLIEAYYYKGLYYISSKQHDKAKDAISSIFALDPNNKEAKELQQTLK